MTILDIREVEAGRYVVEGDLTFAAIDKKTLSASFQSIRGSDKICIDMSGVGTTDSAGLALMIEWIRHAKEHNTRLIFKHIPDQLVTLAKLSGFEDKIHLSEHNTLETNVHTPTHG
jgi:phospholipid transport system transporter-binding protein